MRSGADRRLRILHVIDTLEIGGAERSLYDIYRCCESTEVLLCHLYPGDRLRPLFEAAGIEVASLDLPGRWALRRAARWIEQLCRRHRASLLHATLYRAGIATRLAGRRLGLPVVDSLVNDSYALRRWASLSLAGRLKLAAVRTLDRATAHWVFRGIANSRFLLEAGCADLGLDPRRVVVIPRGRDPQVFRPPGAGEVPALRRRLDVPPRAPLIVNVARLVERKGQLDLLAALARVRRSLPDARLLIAGEGPARPLLERSLCELGLAGSARLLGEWSEVPELLRAADLFVFPSHYEGLPGAVIEAMLSARPIVATDLPAHRELIEPGRTGLLCTAGDATALATTMVRLLGRPEEAERLGQAALGQALERFTHRRVAAAYETFYRNTVEAWQRRGRGSRPEDSPCAEG